MRGSVGRGDASSKAARSWPGRLTEPSPEVVDRADRRTARLVSTLLLLIAPLGALSALLQMGSDGIGGLQFGVALAVVAILATYRLSRTRYFRVAAAITSLIPTAGGIGVFALDQADPGWFAFMALNPALGTLLVTIRWSIVLAAINQLAVVVAVLVVPELDADVGVVAVMFNATIAVVLITAAMFRNRLERDRQADLLAQQRLHEAILAGTFGGIAIVRNGVVVEANSAFVHMFGHVHSDLRGVRIDDLLAPGLYAAVDDARASNSDAPVELTAVRLDGTAFDVEVLMRPIDGVEGSAVVAMRDISRRKQRTDALFRAQRMEAVGRLAAGLAHDTNNQLMVISALTNALDHEHRDAGLPTGKIEQIDRAARRVATQIRRVSMFGRSTDHEPELVDIGEFLEREQPIWEQVLGRGVELDITADEETAAVEIDRTHLEQVLLNLVLNARDAIDGSGRVSVSVTSVDVDASDPRSGSELAPGRYQRIAVVDDGPGIADEHLPHVFDPFYTTKADGRGTGLGLYTSREIVRNMGGGIEITTGDTGTTMNVLLAAARR